MAVATAAAIALGAMAVGTGLSVYGQMQQAKTAQRVGEFNAKQAEEEALNVEMESKENMRRRRAEGARFRSSQRAQIASSGAQLGTGTALELEAETAGLMKLEELDMRRASQIEARRLRAGGAMGLYQAKRESQALKIGAGASLLSGLGNIGFSAYSLSQGKK